MRWEDERWVKVYTRDTTDWLALSFDAQALFLLLLRKVDRIGSVALGKHGKRGVAVIVGHAQSWERLAPALEELLSDGCVSIAEGVLVIPNFCDAQEARTSDKARQAKSRESKAVTKRDAASRNVTESHESSHVVTRGHAASHGVTPRVEESRREETREDLFPDAASAPPAPAKKAKEAKKREPTGDPRHGPLSAALVGLGWPHHGGRTAKALKELLALADQSPATAGDKAQAEILRRAVKAKASTGFPQVREIHELATHWGHFAAPSSQSSALPKADDPDWVTV
jgi:hypothetical protein